MTRICSILFLLFVIHLPGCSDQNGNNKIVDYDLYNVQVRITMNGKLTVEPWKRVSYTLIISSTSLTISDDHGAEKLEFLKDPISRCDSSGATITSYTCQSDKKMGPIELTIPKFPKMDHPSGLLTMVASPQELIYEVRPLKHRGRPRPELHGL